jgi:hypothetical protein
MAGFFCLLVFQGFHATAESAGKAVLAPPAPDGAGGACLIWSNSSPCNAFYGSCCCYTLVPIKLGASEMGDCTNTAVLCHVLCCTT